MLRFIVTYIRSLLCPHDWELIGKITYRDPFNGQVWKCVHTYRCKKCGYVQRVEL